MQQAKNNLFCCPIKRWSCRNHRYFWELPCLLLFFYVLSFRRWAQKQSSSIKRHEKSFLLQHKQANNNYLTILFEEQWHGSYLNKSSLAFRSLSRCSHSNTADVNGLAGCTSPGAFLSFNWLYCKVPAWKWSSWERPKGHQLRPSTLL